MRATVTAAARAALRLGCLWLALLMLPAAAQLPALAGSAARPDARNTVRDLLDRGTPRHSIAAFVRAAHRDDMVSALRYVQNGGRSAVRNETLVRGLNRLLDRHFQQPLSTISDAPEGALDDGLPLDRERVGPLKIGRTDYFVELVRVQDPTSGPVWLISAATLADVPELLDEDERTRVQELLPPVLFKRALFDLSFADLVVWAATLVLPLLLLPLVLRLTAALVRRLVGPARRDAVDVWYRGLRTPLVITITLALQLIALGWFGPTVSFRIAYSRVVGIALAIAATWALHRLVVLAFRHADVFFGDSGRTGVRSIMLLGERLVNVLLLVLAILVVLSLVGFDIKTVLAGVGIVGVAIALGAQKTIENILGGMMLLGDEAIAVGDLCRVNNRQGTVEDITLRSVRFRTLEQTVLMIPAGVLAQAEIENFASRGKMLSLHRLRLASGTSPDALRAVRDAITAYVTQHADVESSTARVRLADVGPAGIEMELLFFVLTRDLTLFAAVREDVLLAALGAAEAAGARLADPGAPIIMNPAR